MEKESSEQRKREHAVDLREYTAILRYLSRDATVPEIVMHYHQINVTPAVPTGRAEVYASPAIQESIGLMRQLVELGKEQHQCLRVLISNQDQSARWKAFLGRHAENLPALGESCKRALPQLEKALGHMVLELTEKIHDESDCIEEEFFLQEFLDRYGTRLNQISTLMNLVGPIADACPPKSPPQQQQEPPQS